MTNLSETKKKAYDNYITAKKTGVIPAGQTLTSLENAIKPPPPVDYVPPNKQETDHNHKHIHINKGPEQSSDVRDDCEFKAEDVPKDIHGRMEGDTDNIKTYKYDSVNQEHQLILSDNIKSKNLETIVESLRGFKFTNFYTGHLEFNLEYIENKEIKSKPYKINLLGKDSVLELEKPLSLKSKSYLKNIKVEGYYFDSDADNRCQTTLVIKNNISSLIVDTYDMTDEFCI